MVKTVAHRAPARTFFRSRSSIRTRPDSTSLTCSAVRRLSPAPLSQELSRLGSQSDKYQPQPKARPPLRLAEESDQVLWCRGEEWQHGTGPEAQNEAMGTESQTLNPQSTHRPRPESQTRGQGNGEGA